MDAMSLFLIIATGVVSGAISALLIFVARTLVLKHFLPWYFDHVYHGIRLDGTWFASPFQMSQDLQMNISQTAGKIRGEAQFARRPEESEWGIEDVRKFSVEGRIQDRYLTLTFSHDNRQRIGVISMLLEPICDGRELNGMMSFVSMRGNYIDALQIHLARDSKLVVSERERLEEELAEQSRPPQASQRRRARRKEKTTVMESTTVPESGLENSENEEKIEIE